VIANGCYRWLAHQLNADFRNVEID
jgi:hypothetical protein